MRQKMLIATSVAAMVLTTGCMRAKWGQAQTEQGAYLAVRFVNSPERPPLVEGRRAYETQLATDDAYDGFAQDARKPWPKAHHVALWGNGFAGRDVTNQVARLAPGDYTFAFLDHDHAASMQGWLWLNGGNTDLLDVLYRWKNSIPQQKAALAYDFELTGKWKRADRKSLAAFDKSLEALNALEKRLDRAIRRELESREQWQQRNRDYLAGADLLLFAGQNEFLRPTTGAAYTPDDLALVRDGGSMTKLLLAADYQAAQWKLDHVNQLYRDIMGYRAVLAEEVARLERLKRRYTITDHLYHHDRKFVENELALQLARVSLDRFDEYANQLRERRIGLAMLTALVAPKEWTLPLDRERRELQQQREVLETARERWDAMFAQAKTDSPHRTAYEEKRQEVIAAMEWIDLQLDGLAEARAAIESLRQSSRIVHRQGESWLLTACAVDSNLPVHVRTAIEREAIMTVRLEPADYLFAPTEANLALQRPVKRVGLCNWLGQ